MRFSLPVYFLAAFLIAPSAAFATCGAANCPIDTHTSEKTQKGWLRLDYGYKYVDQDHPLVWGGGILHWRSFVCLAGAGIDRAKISEPATVGKRGLFPD